MIFFSDNCEKSDKNIVKQTMGIQNEVLSEKYLGLPTRLEEVKRKPLNLYLLRLVD